MLLGRYTSLATLSIPSPVKAKSMNLPVAYLRGFVILLVIAHHSSLPYYPKKPPIPVDLLVQPRWWMAFAVVDTTHFAGFLPFILFNDMFSMGLLFLLSGLFVWKSLEKKRPGGYFKDRLVRLGVPFALSSLASPLIYFPTYLQSRHHLGFWKEWLALGGWPAGPVWFLWVLLAFDGAAIALFTFAPSTLETISRKIAGQQHPSRLLLWLFAGTAIAYVPMLLIYGPFGYWMVGPFFVSGSRFFFYLVYFLFGIALGATQQPALLSNGKLAQRWWLWAITSAASFALLQFVTYLSHRFYYPLTGWAIAIGIAFALSSALTGFAFLALSLRFLTRRRALLDSLFVCSYGIYLIHDFIVVWVQYAMLSIGLPALLKAGVAFCVTVPLSWTLTSLARRSRLVTRFI